MKTGGIHPRNILCVTFTSKAAGEMRRRVRQLVGEGYDTSLITTYHGFCARVLRPDMDKLFYPQNFTILDTADQKKILEEIYETAEHTGLYETLRRHCHDKALRYSGAESFLTMIDTFREQAEIMPPSELLQTILRESGYERYIRENGDMERLDNLAELMKTVTDFERVYGEALSLTDYLRQIELQSGDDAEDERDCVRLMTIHAV